MKQILNSVSRGHKQILNSVSRGHKLEGLASACCASSNLCSSEAGKLCSSNRGLVLDENLVFVLGQLVQNLVFQEGKIRCFNPKNQDTSALFSS